MATKTKDPYIAFLEGELKKKSAGSHKKWSDAQKKWLEEEKENKEEKVYADN